VIIPYAYMYTQKMHTCAPPKLSLYILLEKKERGDIYIYISRSRGAVYMFFVVKCHSLTMVSLWEKNIISDSTIHFVYEVCSSSAQGVIPAQKMT